MEPLYSGLTTTTASAAFTASEKRTSPGGGSSRMCRRSSMIGRSRLRRSSSGASAPACPSRSPAKRATLMDWRPRRTEPTRIGMRSGRFTGDGRTRRSWPEHPNPGRMRAPPASALRGPPCPGACAAGRPGYGSRAGACRTPAGRRRGRGGRRRFRGGRPRGRASTTNASGTVSPSSVSIPTTAASFTRGCCSRHSSASPGENHFPETLSRSSARPW